MTARSAPSGVWAVQQGPEHNYVDGRTHVHHIHLFNQVTGGEHHIQVLLHSPKCRECGRPFAGGAIDFVGIGAEILAATQALEENHSRLMEYVRRTGAPVKLGSLATLVPTGHTLISSNGERLLHPPRAK